MRVINDQRKRKNMKEKKKKDSAVALFQSVNLRKVHNPAPVVKLNCIMYVPVCNNTNTLWSPAGVL